MSTKKDSKKYIKKVEMNGHLTTAIMFAKVDGKWLGISASDDVFCQMIIYGQTISERGRLLMHPLVESFAEALEETKKDFKNEEVRGLSNVPTSNKLQ